MPHLRRIERIRQTPRTAPDGAPYNQVVGGVEYWYQQEWSNRTLSCEQRLGPDAPAVSKLSARKGAAAAGARA